MEFKGTKGKWDLFQDYDHAYSQQVVNISNEIDGCMATVWTGKDRDEEISEETRYNALLLLKAPEMLEMLRRCESRIPDIGIHECLLKDLNQLIKEATEL